MGRPHRCRANKSIMILCLIYMCSISSHHLPSTCVSINTVNHGGKISLRWHSQRWHCSWCVGDACESVHEGATAPGQGDTMLRMRSLREFGGTLVVRKGIRSPCCNVHSRIIDGKRKKGQRWMHLNTMFPLMTNKIMFINSVMLGTSANNVQDNV